MHRYDTAAAGVSKNLHMLENTAMLFSSQIPIQKRGAWILEQEPGDVFSPIGSRS